MDESTQIHIINTILKMPNARFYKRFKNWQTLTFTCTTIANGIEFRELNRAINYYRVQWQGSGHCWWAAPPSQSDLCSSSSLSVHASTLEAIGQRCADPSLHVLHLIHIISLLAPLGGGRGGTLLGPQWPLTSSTHYYKENSRHIKSDAKKKQRHSKNLTRIQGSWKIDTIHVRF